MNRESEDRPALRHQPTAAQLAFVDELRNTCRALILSCGDNQLSHAPFVFCGGDYYIFVSQLAARTGALLDGGCGQVMLLKDESATGNIYSRKRLTQSVRASVVPVSTAQYSAVLDALEARHGKTVSLLRGLPDFHLIRLTPSDGQLVMGFGQAFILPMT